MNSNIGNHIRRFINGWCPSCNESSSLAPGSLSEDEAIEYRTCLDCGATVDDHAPRFWASDAEADEDGIS